MSLVELRKNSTSGIKYIEQVGSLREWAVEFIERENISRETVKTSSTFHALHRREKDAVRYQLRKTQGLEPAIRKAPVRRLAAPQPKAAPVKHWQRWNLKRCLMVGLGGWIAAFLLNDIVGIYQAKGLGPWISWQAAILVELCILVASMGSDSRLHRLAHCLVAYNALVFGFVEVGAVLAQHETNQSVAVTTQDRESQLLTHQAKLDESTSKTRKTLDDLSVLISRGFVSSGSSAFAQINDTSTNSERVTQETIANLKSELEDLKKKEKSILLMGITGFLYFCLRCLLQVYSIWLLRNRDV